MADKSPILLGIDGGSTYSFGVAVDREGEVLGVAQTGSLNFFGSDLRQARRNLGDLVRSLEIRLPTQNAFIKSVVGSQAVIVEAPSEQKERLCKGILPLDETRLVGHSVIAYQGATLGEPAVFVFCGTGSTVLAQNEEGETFQVGGWGHLLGDEGSAYWIAMQSMRAAIAAIEGRGPGTGLVECVCRWFGVKELTDALPMIYHERRAQDRIALLAEHLATTLSDEDGVFTDICWRAGKLLAEQALACLKLVRFEQRPIPIYLCGGVLHRNAFIRSSLLATLKGTYDVSVRTPKLPALLGAAVLALTEVGVEINQARVERLKTSYEGLAGSQIRRPEPSPSSGSVNDY